jgi:hypothetical protein
MDYLPRNGARVVPVLHIHHEGPVCGTVSSGELPRKVLLGVDTSRNDMGSARILPAVAEVCRVLVIMIIVASASAGMAAIILAEIALYSVIGLAYTLLPQRLFILLFEHEEGLQ